MTATDVQTDAPSPQSFHVAAAALSAPGQPFEIATIDVGGLRTKVFVNAPKTLREIFLRGLANGDDTFIVYDDERLSFASVMSSVDALGATLIERYGIRPGDRVAIAMRNFPEWIMSFAGIISSGAISVSLNSWWTEDELAYAIEDSGASVLIADDERLDRCAATCGRLGVKMIGVRTSAARSGVDRWSDVVVAGTPLPLVAITPDMDATILYTSGTTGMPKGAVSTHRAITQALMAFQMRGVIETVRQGPEAAAAAQAAAALAGKPSFILIVPLFHVTGSVPVMLSCFGGGLKLVIMYKWDPEKALELIEREKITNFTGVPTQSWDMVNHPRFADFDTSSLRDVGGGGAPAPASLVAKVAGSIKGGGPVLGYGMTETNAYGPGNRGADYLARPTSTGRWVPVMDIEIRDDDRHAVATGERGTIWFRGPMLIRGYWNKPEATAAAIVDGWLDSGDIGRLDSDGFLYIEDRAKDMILRGGENVYCAEIETAIYELPGIHEAAVFGVPDARLGEEVAVAVHLMPGATFNADAVRAQVASKLASFKVPTHVYFIDEPLPRNAAGKFLKRELTAQFGPKD